MPCLRLFAPGLFVALLLGCTGSDDSADGSADSGASTDGGTAPASDGGDVRPGDGAVSATCTVLGTNVLADDPKELSNLSVAGNSLVFVSADLALTPAPGIEKVQLDGTGRTLLYRPTKDRRVLSVLVQGDRIFFLERDNAAPNPMGELWSLPVTGGTPARLGTEVFPDGRMFGADTTSLYITRLASTGPRFDRINLTTGVLQNVATIAGRGTAGQVSISGNDVFFIAGKTGGDALVSDIFRFDKAGMAVTPTALLGGTDALCDSRLGGLWATPTRLACGFSGVKAAARDGSGIAVVVPAGLPQPSNVLVGTDAENLYVMDKTKGMTAAGTLRKVASTGGPLLPVACDMSTVGNRLVEVVFPVQTEYEVVIGATDVFWIEKRGNAAATRWFVRRAPK